MSTSCAINPSSMLNSSIPLNEQNLHKSAGIYYKRVFEVVLEWEEGHQALNIAFELFGQNKLRVEGKRL